MCKLWFTISSVSDVCRVEGSIESPRNTIANPAEIARERVGKCVCLSYSRRAGSWRWFGWPCQALLAPFTAGKCFGTCSSSPREAQEWRSYCKAWHSRFVKQIRLKVLHMSNWGLEMSTHHWVLPVIAFPRQFVWPQHRCAGYTETLKFGNFVLIKTQP